MSPIANYASVLEIVFALNAVTYFSPSNRAGGVNCLGSSGSSNSTFQISVAATGRPSEVI